MSTRKWSKDDLGYWNKIGLAVQSKEFLPKGYRGNIIRGDVTGEEFEANWSALCAILGSGRKGSGLFSCH